MNSNVTTQDTESSDSEGVNAAAMPKPPVSATTARRDSSKRRPSAWRRTLWTVLWLSIVGVAVGGVVYWMNFAPITVST